MQNLPTLIRLHIADYIPELILKHVWPDIVKSISTEVDKPHNYFTSIKLSKWYCKRYFVNPVDKVKYAIRANSLETVLYYLPMVTENFYTSILGYATCNVMILDHLLMKEKMKYSYEIFENAVRNEHYDAIHYIIAMNKLFINESHVITGMISMLGSIKIIEQFKSNMFINYKMAKYASLHGHVHILKWIVQNNYPIKNTTINHAIRSNDIKTIKYTLNHCQLQMNTFSYACRYGTLEIVKMIYTLHLQHFNTISKSNYGIKYALCNKNAMEIIKYLISIGQTIQLEDIDHRIIDEEFNIDVITWLHDNHNLQYNQVIEHMMTYNTFHDCKLILNECTLTTDLFLSAMFTKIDPYKKIKYLYKHKCPIDNQVLNASCYKGLPVLKLLMKYYLRYNTLKHALNEDVCLFNEDVCLFNEDVCLFNEDVCLFNEETYESAMLAGSVEILKFLTTILPPPKKNNYLYHCAMMSGSKKVVDWYYNL